MSHKHNAARRHRIGKMKFKVTNWTEYDAGLRQRGNLTEWVTSEAVADIGMPVGLTFAGRAHADVALLTLASAFEATGQRRATTDANLVIDREGDAEGRSLPISRQPDDDAR